MRALEAGDAPAAIGALDTARRLRPDDPRAGYNAGTARIGVEPRQAAEILAPAAAAAGPALAPDAWYNLGNAQLAADDAGGAVRSYVEALRLRPGHDETQFNLELALRRLEQQREEEERQRRNPPGERAEAGDSGGSQGESEQSDAGAGEPSAGEGGGADTDPGAEGRPTDEGEPSPGDEEREAQGGPRPDPGEGGERPDAAADGASPRDRQGSRPGEREGPLPQFRDLRDMNAEQAAAILRAVDDLERRARRERAREMARRRAIEEIDW
jgi:Ca-activated chloride channel family protein